MKLIKGLLVIAVMSVLTLSCDQAKKETATDAVETAVEASSDAADATAESAEQAIDSVSADAEKALDSTKVMDDSTMIKCEGTCAKDG